MNDGRGVNEFHAPENLVQKILYVFICKVLSRSHDLVKISYEPFSEFHRYQPKPHTFHGLYTRINSIRNISISILNNTLPP